MKTQKCTMAGWEGVERNTRDVQDNLEALFEDRGNERLVIEPQRLGFAADCDAINAIDGLTISEAVQCLLANDSIWE